MSEAKKEVEQLRGLRAVLEVVQQFSSKLYEDLESAANNHKIISKNALELQSVVETAKRVDLDN